MKRALKILALTLGGLVLLFHFNNCATDVQPTTDTDQGALACEGGDCIAAKDENINIKVNHSGDMLVTSSLSEFNVAGDCNEGGFQDNMIRWELSVNGGPVLRHSGMSNLVTGGGSANGKCVNGRYMLYINLASVPQDPVNRTGLRTGSGTTRATYSLDVKIVSYDNSGQQHNNVSGGSNRLFLAPL